MKGVISLSLVCIFALSFCCNEDLTVAISKRVIGQWRIFEIIKPDGALATPMDNVQSVFQFRENNKWEWYDVEANNEKLLRHFGTWKVANSEEVVMDVAGEGLDESLSTKIIVSKRCGVMLFKCSKGYACTDYKDGFSRMSLHKFD